MIGLNMGFTLLFGTVAFLFVTTTIRALYHLRWVRRLPPLAPPDATATTAGSKPALIRCSIVLAARDEAPHVERTVQRLLAQSGVQVEVIVVDDRSTDRTLEIIQRLSAQDARVQAKHVEVLPEGWLGKSHACHIGAASATGEWILFTDADCWLQQDAVARSLAVAEHEGVDHITLTPGAAPRTAGGAAWHLAFGIGVADWISGVNRDKPKAYFGIGAFNMMRADAYRACGGYEALRLTVVDDLKLGLLLRRSGKRTRAFLGGPDAECQWGVTARSMIGIMEKNYFAALDYRMGVALTLSLGAPLLWAAAIAGPFTGTWAGWAAGLGLMSLMWPASTVARRLGWSMRGVILTPFIHFLVFYAIFNSTWVTWRNGGIRWRGTFYPLKRLKAEGVR